MNDRDWEAAKSICASRWGINAGAVYARSRTGLGRLDGPVSQKEAKHCGQPCLRGIGLATARRFVEEGAYVYITGRRH
jgi:hypothetical protein